MKYYKKFEDWYEGQYGLFSSRNEYLKSDKEELRAAFDAAREFDFYPVFELLDKKLDKGYTILKEGGRVFLLNARDRKVLCQGKSFRDMCINFVLMDEEHQADLHERSREF